MKYLENERNRPGLSIILTKIRGKCIQAQFVEKNSSNNRVKN
jgi:hypothetical protein